MVVMTWLAVVFIWFGLTVFRGARKHFAWGALWSAIVILGATNLMNPDAFITRTNLELMDRGREFDAFYSHELSADAIPALLPALSRMSLDDRCQVQSDLHYRYRQLGQSFDLRSWNWSRRQAYGLLLANDRALHEQEGCPSQFLNDQNPNPESGDQNRSAE